MKEIEFKKWMEGLGTMTKRPIGDTLSRCRRIKRDLNVDLDEEFMKDNGKSLLDSLDYSIEDAIAHRPLPGYLELSGEPKNVRASMASLRGAVKKYMEFRNATR